MRYNSHYVNVDKKNAENTTSHAIYHCCPSVLPDPGIPGRIPKFTRSYYGAYKVSWVRQRDLQILTVGTYTYTSDQRFHSTHLEGSEDWTLEVRYTQKGDAGVYECQISTEPKMSLNISLAVVVVKARIPEGSNLYIQSGSTINLTCVVTDSRAPPVYVFWYHDDRMIHYHSARAAGIRVATERGPSTTVSRLQVPDAATGDSGNYSCIPSYADPAYITVHVINDFGARAAERRALRRALPLAEAESAPYRLVILSDSKAALTQLTNLERALPLTGELANAAIMLQR
ncbi:hypothetical protein HPB47_021245 [Ixodes persulcatus]|uniref:Uncharacterized protein n=1 Tax=Ixodes persulcatus TaxID=34615 RepID=A0AC60QGB3_IXOPE|nr:hypothetical protein HPB47_021245 [Ixodes persulcatus]